MLSIRFPLELLDRLRVCGNGNVNAQIVQAVQIYLDVLGDQTFPLPKPVPCLVCGYLCRWDDNFCEGCGQHRLKSDMPARAP